MKSCCTIEGPTPGPKPERSGEFPIAVHVNCVPGTFEVIAKPVKEPEHISETIPEFVIDGEGLMVTMHVAGADRQVPMEAVIA